MNKAKNEKDRCNIYIYLYILAYKASSNVLKTIVKLSINNM